MIRRWWISVALLAVCCGAAEAQVELERFQRQLEQIQRETRLLASPDIPPEQRALIDYGGYLSFNFLAIDDTEGDRHILRQTSLVGFANVNFDGAHEFFVRASTTYSDFNTGHSFDDHGDDWVEPTLDRAHYRFDLRRAIQASQGRTVDGNLTLQVGRQLVHWANGLTLSWEIDGGQVGARWERLQLDTVAGITRRSTTDIDSSRPGFTRETKRGFFGGMLSFEASPRHTPFIYGLMQQDYNDDERFVFDPGTPADPTDDITTRFGYDTYYIGVGSGGSLGDRLLYAVELVYQGGRGLSNSFDPATGAQVRQTWEDIHAFAADVRLDYLFADANNTRLSGELIVATGDSDRQATSTTFGGNQSGTDDHAFNAFGLINTGLAFAPSVSNVVIVRLGASTFPLPSSQLFRRLQVGTNVFLYNKFNPNAPIDEATRDRMYLGFEPDVYANWQITSDLTWTVRYGVFFPGAAIEADHDARHFFFTGVTLAF